MRSVRFAFAVLLFFSFACIGRSAAAAPPEDADRSPTPPAARREAWSFALLGTWGAASVASLLGDSTASERYGVGLSAGYTFRPGLYTGVVGALRRGDIAGDLARGGEGGIEVGWDIPLGIAVARPLAGGGAAQRESAAAPAVWPGIAILGSLPSTRFFAGVDARLVLAFVDRRVAAAPTSFIVAGARL